MSESELSTLSALRRLRRVETDTARRALGEAVTQEAALSARDAALAQDLGEARQLTGDFDREAFAAWFIRMRAERALLGAAMREAEARTAAGRADLAQRRLAETAAEEALARAVATRDAAVAAREQVMLEDVSRALRRAAEEGAGRPQRR